MLVEPNIYEHRAERVRLAQLQLALSLLKPSLKSSRSWSYPPHPDFLVLDLNARGMEPDGSDSHTISIYNFMEQYFPGAYKMAAFTKAEDTYRAVNRLFYDKPQTKVILDRKLSPLEDVQLWVEAQGIQSGTHSCGLAFLRADGTKEAKDNLDVFRYLNGQTATDRVDMVIQMDLSWYKAQQTQGRSWAQGPILNFIDQFAIKYQTFVAFPPNYRADLITLIGVNHNYPMESWMKYNVYSYDYWRVNYLRWVR